MLRKRCMVFDMDGTVYLGPVPIEGTVNFIKKNWGKIDFQFLSNNTSKSPVTYVKRLNSMGIPATLNQILTPITPLIHYLKRVGIKRAYLVGNTDFVTCMKERMPELTNTAEGAEAVILAYDTELTYEKIKTSALLLWIRKSNFLPRIRTSCARPMPVPFPISEVSFACTKRPRGAARNASSASLARKCSSRF